MGRRAVFLDRDGVLTVPELRDGRSFAPTRLDAFALYDDAVTSVAQLKSAGFMVIVVTNQPDVSTGRIAPDTLDEMHRRLRAQAAVDDIEVSITTGADPDGRRKPAPGMLIDASRKWGLDLAQSYMVGDRASDIACGMAAGCRTVFIDRGYSAETPPNGQNATGGNLAEAVDWILKDGEK